MRYKQLIGAKSKLHYSQLQYGYMTPAKEPVRHIALSVLIMVITSGLCLFLDTVINDFIAKKHPQVKMVDIFFDGPASQFKNKYKANFCCKLERLKSQVEFFATSHKKGVVDVQVELTLCI